MRDCSSEGDACSLAVCWLPRLSGRSSLMKTTPPHTSALHCCKGWVSAACWLLTMVGLGWRALLSQVRLVSRMQLPTCFRICSTRLQQPADMSAEGLPAGVAEHARHRHAIHFIMFTLLASLGDKYLPPGMKLVSLFCLAMMFAHHLHGPLARCRMSKSSRFSCVTLLTFLQ